MLRDDIHPVRFILAAILLALAVYTAVSRRWTPTVGQYGYNPDPEGTAEFLRELEHPTFSEAGPEAVAQAKGVDTFLYRHVDRSHRSRYGSPWVCWNQGSAGTCVAFAFGLAAYTGQCVDWSIGKLPVAPLEVATEPIYGGSRTAGRQPPITVNNGGDGSYGAAAARWVAGKTARGVGGILWREKYGSHDLTRYSIPLSREWGRFGVPADLTAIAGQNRALAVAQVNNWGELCAAIESGYSVVLCSTVGYGGRSSRDADGFLSRGSSWAHAMLVWAVRHQKNGSPRDGGLIQNSWSASWLGGPKWPADQPDGSFWASRPDIEAALAQGDSFAVGGISFAYRDLDHGDWLAPFPSENAK